MKSNEIFNGWLFFNGVKECCATFKQSVRVAVEIDIPVIVNAFPPVSKFDFHRFYGLKARLWLAEQLFARNDHAVARGNSVAILFTERFRRKPSVAVSAPAELPIVDCVVIHQSVYDFDNRMNVLEDKPGIA